VLTGGERDPRTSSLVGAAAMSSFAAFRFDVAFLSSAAVDPEHGGLEATPEEAAIDEVLARQARRVVLGADSSKLGASAAMVGLRWADIDLLVTELPPHSERLTALREVVEMQ
jgi:DeoR/GlpR family transcriptional regulator of sugar metabolism